MNDNKRAVPFGAEQSAVITPKEGYEVEKVKVINTTTGEEVPSKLEKTSDSPLQWTCYFRQPAGAVAIKASMKPALYSVTIEPCENCSIVLLEADDAATIEIKAVGNGPTENETKEDSTANFNEPQYPDRHEDDTTPVGDVEEKENNETDLPENIIEDNNDINDLPDTTISDESVEHDKSDSSNSSDIINKDDENNDELMDYEPVYISQAEYDEKNKTFWDYRHALKAGRITQEKFAAVEKKHTKFLDDISVGKIIVGKRP